MIAKVTSYDGEIIWDINKPDGTSQKLLDVSKLKQLGWNSKIELADGLDITYKQYKKNLEKKPCVLNNINSNLKTLGIYYELHLKIYQHNLFPEMVNKFYHV